MAMTCFNEPQCDEESAQILASSPGIDTDCHGSELRKIRDRLCDRWRTVFEASLLLENSEPPLAAVVGTGEARASTDEAEGVLLRFLFDDLERDAVVAVVPIARVPA